MAENNKFDPLACEPLAEFMAARGAEMLNFWRFMIKEYQGDRGYYREKAIFHISEDGTIKCPRHKNLEPDEETAARIKSAWALIAKPKFILAKSTYELRQQLGVGAALFEFYSNKPGEEGGIIMVQERRQLANGSKNYFPWVQDETGSWLMMEPRGALPFWKPRKRRCGRIMIHEGAKAAAFATAIAHGDGAVEIEDGAHPWKEELSDYDHFGMIGGALAPERTDYEELRRERPTEVVYVCDNDWPGKDALRKVSRCYGGALKGVMFDDRWPMAWDIADRMPTEFFRGERYIGPRISDLMIAATWATEKDEDSDSKKKPNKLRDKFKEEWFHCITPEVFVHKDWPARTLGPNEFNSAVAPYSDVDDTARLMRKDAASKTAVLKYDPGRPSGIYGSGESGRYINTHVPTLVKAERGDTRQWDEFVAHLIPDPKDRLELLRWCATLIARPGTKMLYGVLLISENQGVGKGTFGEKILAPLVGAGNVSFPSETEIVESTYNYWSAHKRLAVIHEIYAGHSSKAYQKLQSIITDKFLTVSKKFVANYEIENWVHVLACSNSKRAIQLPGDDRRWFVPKVTEEAWSGERWNEFYRWLNEDGGLGIVRWWAEDFLTRERPVLSGERAPWSSLKREVVEEGYSQGMAFVSELLDYIEEKSADEGWLAQWCKPSTANGGWEPNGVLVLDRDLVEAVKNYVHQGRNSDRLEKPLTLRKVAKFKGWKVRERPITIREWGTFGQKVKGLFFGSKDVEADGDELKRNLRPLNLDGVIKERGGEEFGGKI